MVVDTTGPGHRNHRSVCEFRRVMGCATRSIRAWGSADVTGVEATPAADQNLVHQNESGSTLGAGIRSERLRQGLTLTHLAERADLSASALSQIERSITDPSIGSLRRIASALQVPFFQFLVDPHSPAGRGSQSRQAHDLVSTQEPPVSVGDAQSARAIRDPGP